MKTAAEHVIDLKAETCMDAIEMQEARDRAVAFMALRDAAERLDADALGFSGRYSANMLRLWAEALK